MKIVALSAVIVLTIGIFVGCGTANNTANDINRLFDDVMPDGIEATTDFDNRNGNNGMSDDNRVNGRDLYEYNNNHNNVYGTTPDDFNRVGYNGNRTGNVDFDITPSNFASEKNTEVTTIK